MVMREAVEARVVGRAVVVMGEVAEVRVVEDSRRLGPFPCQDRDGRGRRHNPAAVALSTGEMVEV